MIKIHRPLLTLLEQIHKPFVQRLITLLVSGLIALLLGSALLLAGHGTFVTNLTQGPVSTAWCITGHLPLAANNMSVW